MEDSAALNAQFESREIPLDLIDEPQVPERETMEETDLAELAMSIGGVGLIKPLIVKPMGVRYEVVAGHRRLIGCRLANYSPVPCRIKVNGEVDPLAILVAENAHTESVNPVHEARFYQRLLLERCENDVDLVCATVRRKRAHVEDRLVLLQGYPAVVDALEKKKIPLAVARELNKVKFPNQLMLLLDTCITQGATARTVMGWCKELNANEDFRVTFADSASQAETGVVNVPGFQQLCFFCEDGADPHLMVTVAMHRPCHKMVEKLLGRDPQSNAQGAH